MEARLQQLADVLPGQRGVHILPGAGHWIQRERAAEVNALLIEFLRGL
jgi:pimeloyl-ACP methyl ester carboxylesterase